MWRGAYVAVWCNIAMTSGSQVTVFTRRLASSLRNWAARQVKRWTGSSFGRPRLSTTLNTQRSTCSTVCCASMSSRRETTGGRAYTEESAHRAADGLGAPPGTVTIRRPQRTVNRLSVGCGCCVEVTAGLTRGSAARNLSRVLRRVAPRIRPSSWDCGRPNRRP